MAIKDWSTTAASNNSASPNGAPEGMAPSGVNDTIRELMAQVRSWYEDPAWINFGYTYTYVGATQFKVSGQDVTAKYPVGRRVRAVGSTTGTIYGLISVSSFSTDTTITVVWDSGSLSNETLQISAGLPSLGKPIPYASLGLTGLVALADLVTAAQSTIMGRAAGAGTGTRTDLSAAQVKAILAIAEADITLADNTTNNATTSAHGFLKKLSNTATEFMNGVGNWATPASGGDLVYLGAVALTGTTASVTGLGTSNKGYVIIVDGFSATATGALRVALSANNGSSYGTARTCSAALNTAAATHYGIVLIDKTDETANKQISWFNASTALAGQGSGSVQEATTTGATNALQFSSSSGDLDAGNAQIYAIQ